MTIASEIQRIQGNIANAYTACENKGATLPASQTSANLASTISAIPAGTSATLVTKTITENGTYAASSDSADGYSSVAVNVSGGGNGVLEALIEDVVAGNNPVSTTSLRTLETEIAGIIPYQPLITKTITAAGTYNAVDDNANGYSSVVVLLNGISVYDSLNIPFNCQFDTVQEGLAVSGLTMVDRNFLPEADLLSPKAQSSFELGFQAGDIRPIYLGTFNLNGTNSKGYLLPNATTTYEGGGYGHNYVRYNNSNSEWEYCFDSLTAMKGSLTNIRISDEYTNNIWYFGALKEIYIAASMSVSQNNVQAILMPNVESARLTKAFQNFRSLAYISMPKLKSLTTSLALGGNAGSGGAFKNTLITELRFPSLNSNSFGSYTNQFNYMLSGVSGCVVHFPINLQSVIGDWDSVLTGFGGNNTVVLFDLPATT